MNVIFFLPCWIFILILLIYRECSRKTFFSLPLPSVSFTWHAANVRTHTHTHKRARGASIEHFLTEYIKSLCTFPFELIFFPHSFNVALFFLCYSRLLSLSLSFMSLCSLSFVWYRLIYINTKYITWDSLRVRIRLQIFWCYIFENATAAKP